MKRIYTLLTAASLTLTCMSVNAQLYSYTNDLDGNPSVVAVNAAGTALARVNGTLLTEACADGFNSNHFSKSAMYTVNRPAIEFTITPDAGYTLSVTAITADMRVNPKGPLSWRFQYSTDGGASWTNNGSDLIVTSGDCASGNILTWDIEDFTAAGTVWVRMVGFGAYSAANGKATLRNITLDGTVNMIDLDGDGYGTATDCNDEDPLINPGASEICNGLDENCNGDIDEGLIFETYYADADGDGYGDAAVTTTACDGPPAGYVADDTDCNDADASVNPGASEICNGLDENCNGDIDEGLIFETYFADADGDGYGDAAMTTTTCDGPPAGYVADATDCNDADASVNPGAAEACNGIDDNCNGDIDEGALITFYADADGDGYGDAGMSADACEAPAGYVADNTDCNDADAGVNPGATEICGNGIDENCDGVADDADVTASFEIVGVVPACSNDGVYFQSTATGAGISYQWYRNEVMLAGATADTYTPTNSGYYQLEVTNGTCTAITELTYVIIKKSPEPDVYTELGTDVCVNGFVKIKAIPNPGTGSTYVWYFNDDVLAGATTELITTSEAGEYYVVVTGPNGCSGVSETVTVTADCRLAEANNGSIALYPNPTAGTFTISMNSTQFDGDAIVQVVDITGRVIYTNNIVINNGDGMAQVSLNDDIVSGVYMVFISAGERSWNSRILIAK